MLQEKKKPPVNRKSDAIISATFNLSMSKFGGDQFVYVVVNPDESRFRQENRDFSFYF